MIFFLNTIFFCEIVTPKIKLHVNSNFLNYCDKNHILNFFMSSLSNVCSFHQFTKLYSWFEIYNAFSSAVHRLKTLYSVKVSQIEIYQHSR